MDVGARLAEEAGADIIDINMGCPARQVTRGLSGSALMRDLDHALTLVEATVKAVSVPVTLKMRLGWDHDMRAAIAIRLHAADHILAPLSQGFTRHHLADHKPRAKAEGLLADRPVGHA